MSDSAPPILGDLVKLHGRDLLRFLTRAVGWQDAPDLVQETYLRVLRHAESGEMVEPHAFLRAIALNLAKDHRRRRRTESKYVAPGEIPVDIAAPAPSLEDGMEAKERLRKLQVGVAALPPRCRDVFVLRRFEGLSQDEIAKRLGISRNMVEKHLRLALTRCRAAIE